MSKTPEYITVTFKMEINGKFVNGRTIKYKRGRESYAFTLDDVGSLIFMYDHLLNSGSTYAMDGLLQEAEIFLPKKDNETAQTVFERYWINLSKTINAQFEERNKGIKGDYSPWPAENDYLVYQLINKCKNFSDSPLPVKYGFLYYLYKYVFNSSIEEISADVLNIPQYVKDLVDERVFITKK